MTDRTGRSVAVNLYNLAPGKGVIIGDSVAIAEPYFTRVSVAPSSDTAKGPYLHDVRKLLDVLILEPPVQSLYVVVRNCFLRLLNCSAWPCLGPA